MATWQGFISTTGNGPTFSLSHSLQFAPTDPSPVCQHPPREASEFTFACSVDCYHARNRLTVGWSRNQGFMGADGCFGIKIGDDHGGSKSTYPSLLLTGYITNTPHSKLSAYISSERLTTVARST